LPGRETPSLLYLPDLPEVGGEAVLGEDESHYVTRGARPPPGAALQATDGAGRVADLELDGVGPRATARVLAARRMVRSRESWVLCGAPEGQRGDWVVEKLAELGVARFLPVRARRADWRGVRIDRWRKLAIAALRQSRRAHLLDVLEPMDLATALRILPAGSTRWLAAQDGEAAPGPAGAEVQVGAVGPAEGWDDAERAAFAGAGFRRLRLADARLRAETAAVAWAVWWSLGAA
jgi:16S rRNA (uracil1498-N3)-methyltransferase